MKKILGLLLTINAWAVSSGDSVQYGKYFEGRNPESVNYIKNSSCFKNVLNITGTNTTLSRNTTTPLTSIADCQATLDSATDTVDFSTNTLDRSLKNGNCEVSMRYKLTLGSGNTIQLQARINSATVASADLVTSDNGTATVNFPCGDLSNAPSLRIAQTAGSSSQAINVSNVYLGAARNIGTVAQATLVGQAYYAATTNCIWSLTSTSFADFGTDADCPAPTIEQNSGPGTISTTDADLPQVTVSGLAPGNYKVTASLHSGYTATSGNIIGYRLSDGTTSGGNVTHVISAAADETIQETIVMAFSYASAGDRTFKIQGFSSANTVTIANQSNERRVTFTIERFPSSSEVAYRPEQDAWLVDANISGANISVGSGAVTSYTGITDASLTLTNNSSKGSNSSVQIGCSTTVAPSGTTCSSGSESISVSFTPPKAGLYDACVYLGSNISNTAGSNGTVYYQVVETATDAQTVIQEGGARTGRGQTAAAANDTLDGNVVCGTFNFSNTSRKMLRLFYQQSSGVAGHTVVADGSGTNGGRDIKWTVRPLSQNMPAPLLVGSVTSNSTGAERVERVNFGDAGATSACTASPCTIHKQSGSWVTSVTRAGAGDYTINVPSGMFSQAPVCVCIVQGGYNRVCSVDGTSTTTAIQIYSSNGGTASGVDYNINVICQGPR